MAKKAKKRKKKTKRVEKLFKGNLQSVKKAINAAAKLVERGRKEAAKQVALGKGSPIGSPAHKHLADNEESLWKAEQMLDAFREAKGLMARQCCNQDENCNFVVRKTIVTKAVSKAR